MLKESNAIEGVFDRQSLIQAHRAWKYLMLFDKIDWLSIKIAHNILMENQDIAEPDRGNWRNRPVWIGGEKKSQPPLVIQNQIEEWCDHVNEIIDKKAKNHESTHCHVQFEEIHPFIDGNGRLGRMLMNWQELQLDCPLIVYKHTDRKTYYRLFPSYRSREMDTMMKLLMEDWKKRER